MNMSNSTENVPTPIVQEFNLQPDPSATTISDLENTCMNMSTSENVPTPIIREFNLLPVPSPTTISDLENTHMNMSNSTENIPTPSIQEFDLERVPSPATISGSSKIEKDTSSSPTMSQPSVLESFGTQHVLAPLPGSANSEKVADYSLEHSHLPGLCLEKLIPETVPSSPSHVPGNNTCSSPQASAPPGWKHTSPCPSPLEENVVNMDISPNNSHPPPGWDDIGPGSAPPTPAIPGMSQVVCGNCRQILSYPQGTTRVKCPCCQTVNFVLEEHQVGTVKCAKCWVWLMYPYGAPAVRCSACRFVTQIGVDNARPPLSVQQNRSFVSPSLLQ